MRRDISIVGEHQLDGGSTKSITKASGDVITQRPSLRTAPNDGSWDAIHVVAEL